MTNEYYMQDGRADMDAIIIGRHGGSQYSISKTKIANIKGEQVLFMRNWTPQQWFRWAMEESQVIEFEEVKNVR